MKMKVTRFLLSLLLVCAFALGAAAPASAIVLATDMISTQSVDDRQLTITQGPDAVAKAGLLIDGDGKVLWSRAVDEKRAMASITKVMTAVVALENLDPNQTVTVSSTAAHVGESSAKLRTGEKIKVKELIKGLLVVSGNDAAEALAESTAGGVTEFVSLMNAKAEALGLKNTHFENPHGLDAPNHYTTAADLGLLVRYAMSNPTIASVVSKPKVKIKHSWGTVTAESTNLLLKEYEGANGVKTGYTDPAGYCLASGAKRGDLQLYAVVLGSSSESMRFVDSQNLLDWGFEHYVSTPLVEGGQTVAHVSVSDLVDTTVEAVAENPVTTPIFDFDGPIDVQTNTARITSPVKAGDVVGSVKWVQGDTVIASTKLVAKESVEAPSFFGRVGITLSRAWRGITGKPTSAKTSVTITAPVVVDPAYDESDS